MLLPVIIFGALGIVLFLVNFRRKKHVWGLEAGGKQLLGVLPILAIAFILAGMLEVLLPEEFVRTWLAREAGFRGIFLGTLGGMLMAMGPYASFPIIASIYGAGAGLGTVIALITGWSLLGLSRVPFEAGTLGIKFSLIRMGLGFPFCLAAGLVAHWLEGFFF